MNKKKFCLRICHNKYRKGEILMLNSNTKKVIVIKVYDKVWWVKLFRFLGIKTKPFGTIKVKSCH